MPLPMVDVHYGPEVDGEYRPSGLRQKLAIIAKNVVIGWAGRFDTASDVVNGLRERCVHDKLNSRQVAEYLRSQSRSTWEEIELAGFVFNRELNRVSSFGCNCATVEIPMFGEIGLLGTGRPILETFFRTNLGEPACPQEPENLAVRAVSYGMAALGNCLTMEQFACESLDSKFGGGYEIATLSYDEFVKLNNVLYLFWHASIHRDDQAISLADFPFCAFRYEYYEDLLVVRGIGIGENDGRIGSEDRTFPIPPAHRYLTLKEKTVPPVPRLNADWVCNFVQIDVAPGEMDILTSAAYAKCPPWIEFEEKEGCEIKLTTAPSLRQDILAGIAKRPGLSGFTFRSKSDRKL